MIQELPAVEGPLVLADISGYTSFVARTELEHSQYLIRQLLHGIVASFEGRLHASQVEGDGIFFVGEGFSAQLLGWLEGSYRDFHRNLKEIVAVTKCPCRACALAPTLTMKVIGHYGRYSTDRIGTVEHLHGIDVIVAHRLAKNSVPSHEYLLLTAPVLERLSPDERGRFTPYREVVGEFGPLKMGYMELSSVRT